MLQPTKQNINKEFEKEVKEFQEAYGHEAAYALDVVVCKLLKLQLLSLLDELPKEKYSSLWDDYDDVTEKNAFNSCLSEFTQIINKKIEEL